MFTLRSCSRRTANGGPALLASILYPPSLGVVNPPERDRGVSPSETRGGHVHLTATPPVHAG